MVRVFLDLFVDRDRIRVNQRSSEFSFGDVESVGDAEDDRPPTRRSLQTQRVFPPPAHEEMMQRGELRFGFPLQEGVGHPPSPLVFAEEFLQRGTLLRH